MIVPVLLIGGVLLGVWVHTRPGKVLTPEREAVYQQTMLALKDPSKLNLMADAFAKEGLTEQAANLRKRAQLPTIADAQKKKLQTAFRAALQSTDTAAIHRLATVFEQQGAMSSATALRQYANGLKVQSSARPVSIAPTSPSSSTPTESTES